MISIAFVGIKKMRLARSATDGGVTLDQGEPGPGCQLLGPSHNVHIPDTRHLAPGVRVPAPVRMIMVIVTWSALIPASQI